MLCCWKKTTEVKTLSKPLLAESKSVTGEPKILTERRTPSVPVPIKSELTPAKTFPVSPPKLDSAYSYPASIPAPIYVKSELPPVELKPISIPVEVKPNPVPAPVEVKQTLPEDNPTPIETKPIQKKNFKSNKRG